MARLGHPSRQRSLGFSLQSCLRLFSQKQTGAFQTTLSRPVSRAGVGLHSGDIASLSLLPAAAGDGRYFVSKCPETNEEVRVPACISSVLDTTLSTCIGSGQTRFRTVEHLLAALEGLGVDNCRIEIGGGNEVPLLDGSAKSWVEAIHEAGLSLAINKVGKQVRRNVFILGKLLFVSEGESFVAAFPSAELRVTYGIEFRQVPAIGTQWFSTTLNNTTVFEDEVAPARTFGILEQIGQLQAAGLVKGGSLDNSLVCSMKDGWLNPPLRFPDEPCRHKLLDLIGDLSLCGMNGNPGLPMAQIIAFKAGHKLHVELGRTLIHHLRDVRNE